MILTNQRERSRFIKFALVGLIGAIVDFGVFNLLAGVFQVPAVWASVCSFVVAVMSNFMWNRYWTYPDSRTKSVHQQMAQFAAVSIIGLSIRTPLFAYLEPHLIGWIERTIPGLPLSSTVLGHNIGLSIAIVVVMMWNFFANRLWTYGDVE